MQVPGAPDFDTLVTPRRVDANRFAFDVPDGWQQGRGAFGGLVLAVLARAIVNVADRRELSLHSLTATLPAPTLVGSSDIDVETLRIGSGTATLAARLVQGSSVCAHAVGVLGRVRARDADGTNLTPPAVPPWRSIEPFGIDGQGFGPHFAQHIEFRNVGTAPFARGPAPRTVGWVSLRAPGPTRDEAFLVAMADTWWPSIFSVIEAPRPMATIAFSIQLLGTCEGLDPDVPLLYEARTDAVRDGYASETRTLWGHDGRLLAINLQTFVIIQ